MKRSQIVQLSLLASMAAMLTGCKPKPTRYCVDAENRVVEEDNCNQSRSGPMYIPYHWYYGGARGFVPTGTVLRGGSTEVPAEGFSRPSSSGTVRGGIGEAGEAAGSGHGGEGGAGE